MTGFRVWLGPLAIGLASLAAIMVLSLSPRPGQPVTAVFPPGQTEKQSFLKVAAAGLPILRVGPLPNLVTVPGGTAKTAMRLKRAGAVLVINGAALPGCGTEIKPLASLGRS